VLRYTVEQLNPKQARLIVMVGILQEYKVNQRRTAMIYTMKIFQHHVIAPPIKTDPVVSTTTNSSSSSNITTPSITTSSSPTTNIATPTTRTAHSHSHPLPTPIAQAQAQQAVAVVVTTAATTTTTTALPPNAVPSTQGKVPPPTLQSLASTPALLAHTSDGSRSFTSTSALLRPQLSRISCSSLLDNPRKRNEVVDFHKNSGPLSARACLTPRDLLEIEHQVKSIQHPFLAKTRWTYELGDEVW
jgi:hypothetical protein